MRFAAMMTGALALTASAQAQVQPQPSTSSGATAAQERATPALAGYTRDLLLGEVWKRPNLASRDRSLITVAALIATGGNHDRMRSHFNLALDNGLKPRELSATITHLAFYAGWPNAVGAAEVASEVYQKRGIPRDQVVPLVGQLPPQLNPKRAGDLRAALAPLSPALANYTVDHLFGEVWRNRDLAARDRSMATIAALIATGNEAELPAELDRGLDNGITKDELGEMVTHLAFYIGWPKAMSATPVILKALADRGRAAASPPSAQAK